MKPIHRTQNIQKTETMKTRAIQKQGQRKQQLGSFRDSPIQSNNCLKQIKDFFSMHLHNPGTRTQQTLP